MALGPPGRRAMGIIWPTGPDEWQRVAGIAHKGPPLSLPVVQLFDQIQQRLALPGHGVELCHSRLRADLREPRFSGTESCLSTSFQSMPVGSELESGPRVSTFSISEIREPAPRIPSSGRRHRLRTPSSRRGHWPAPAIVRVALGDQEAELGPDSGGERRSDKTINQKTRRFQP